ncbi:MAG TPA: hypothetical protein VH682_20420 [Gemmataceae bacterium]|jgi:hypothetical protein
MRHWILRVLPKLIRRTRRSAPPCRPILEQLEDRCVPSANPMQPMGMDMPPMGMQTMNMQTMSMPSMGMQTMSMPTMSTSMTSMNMMNNGLNPNTLAAINQLFMDFNQTLRQVLSSQSLPQFFANEMHMRDVLTADLMRITSSLDGMG